jgi:hypothetical protein
VAHAHRGHRLPNAESLLSRSPRQPTTQFCRLATCPSFSRCRGPARLVRSVSSIRASRPSARRLTLFRVDEEPTAPQLQHCTVAHDDSRRPSGAAPLSAAGYDAPAPKSILGRLVQSAAAQPSVVIFWSLVPTEIVPQLTEIASTKLPPRPLKPVTRPFVPQLCFANAVEVESC